MLRPTLYNDYYIKIVNCKEYFEYQTIFLFTYYNLYCIIRTVDSLASYIVKRHTLKKRKGKWRDV